MSPYMETGIQITKLWWWGLAELSGVINKFVPFLVWGLLRHRKSISQWRWEASAKCPRSDSQWTFRSVNWRRGTETGASSTDLKFSSDHLQIHKNKKVKYCKFVLEYVLMWTHLLKTYAMLTYIVPQNIFYICECLRSPFYSKIFTRFFFTF